jgi:hypothetical protein
VTGVRLLFPFLLLALLLGGCHQVYSQFCGETKERITCLRPADALAEEVLDRYLPGLEDAACPYVLQASHHEITACSAPGAKALGSDFDGYVKLQVYRGGSCYYRAQLDYKSGDWHDALPKLTRALRKELIAP